MGIYGQLFFTFCKIGLFGFGGGYAMLPLIQHEVVERHAWLTVEQFTDIVAISQATPGPIALNSATYIGYTATGGNLLGAALCTLAVSLPSIVIMMILCRFFLKFHENRYVKRGIRGLQVVVIGLIGSAALMLITPQNFVDWKSIVIAVAVFALTLTERVSPILLILAAGLAGYLLF